MTKKEPKTMAQMRAEALGVNGWACPRCGCQDWRGEKNSEVESTRHPKGMQVSRRKRICRHCGEVGFTTDEVVVPPGYRAIVVPDKDDGDERATLAFVA